MVMHTHNFKATDIPGAIVSEGEGGIVINTGLASSMGGYLSPIERGQVMIEFDCEKCGTGDYLVLNIGIGDVVCEGCGEWQNAILNDVWERVG